MGFISLVPTVPMVLHPRADTPFTICPRFFIPVAYTPFTFCPTWKKKDEEEGEGEEAAVKFQKPT